MGTTDHTDWEQRCKQAEARARKAEELLARERRMRVSGERLRDLVRNMPVMVAAFDRRGVLVFWNKECERVTGFPEEIMVNNPRALERIYPDRAYRENMLAMWARRGDDFRQWEWVVRCADGQDKLVAWSGMSSRFAFPGWDSWIMGVDLTERARIEQLVIKAKQDWEQTFDSVDDSIALLDSSFRVTRLNKAMARRLDRHPRDLVGVPLRDLLDGAPDEERRDDVFSFVRGMAVGGRDNALELPIRRMGGVFLVTLSSYAAGDESGGGESGLGEGADAGAGEQPLSGEYAVPQDGGDGGAGDAAAPDQGGRATAIFVARDVSRWKQLEDQLRQAQKMEALGTLAGGIAHDFNNILGVIVGYTEMTLMSLDQVPTGPGASDAAGHDAAGHAGSGELHGQAAGRLDKVLAACRRARDLVSQILTFSRQDPQEKRPLHVTPLVKETLALHKPAIPANVAVRSDFSGARDVVVANPSQIHQVLMNLLVNAVQAMGEAGGELVVRLAEERWDGSRSHGDDYEGLGNMGAGNYLCLSVADTGPGMSEDVRRRMFEPFFTTKRPGEGTGMGLAVVHGAVAELGGGVRVESRPGQGTEIVVCLPLAEQEQEQAEPAPVVGGEALPTGSGHILLVDDEPGLVEVGREWLSGLGYEVSAHADPHVAEAAFLAHPETFDLVITDHAMPGMDGVELASRILAQKPDLPIVLCSGYTEPVAMDRARAIGIGDFLSKPVSRERLARIIHERLKGGRGGA